MTTQPDQSEASGPEQIKPVPPVWTIAPPVFSRDRPIEEIILEYVRSMRRNWQTQQTANIWGNVRKEAKSIIMAYESVEHFIVREMELRAKIAARRQERVNDLLTPDPETTTEVSNAPETAPGKDRQ